MHSHEIVGYIADGETYCAQHAPDDDSAPIFAGDESYSDDACPECAADRGDHDALHRKLAPGARVRCAYREGHEGTLLAKDDPRAWAGSLAFPLPNPDPAHVRRHVAKCQRDGLLKDDRHPVLWSFLAPTGEKVYWDSQLSRESRPCFTHGLTPREVLDLHAREACRGQDAFPMRLVGVDELRAAQAAGIDVDGGGNCRVLLDDLGDVLEALHQLDDSDDPDDALREAAQQLRSSIVEHIGVEEV